MNKWTELLLGLILVVVALVVAFYSQNWDAWNFWDAAGVVFKGLVFWAIVGLGALFILLGISDLKDKK